MRWAMLPGLFVAWATAVSNWPRTRSTSAWLKSGVSTISRIRPSDGARFALSADRVTMLRSALPAATSPAPELLLLLGNLLAGASRRALVEQFERHVLDAAAVDWIGGKAGVEAQRQLGHRRRRAPRISDRDAVGEGRALDVGEVERRRRARGRHLALDRRDLEVGLRRASWPHPSPRRRAAGRRARGCTVRAGRPSHFCRLARTDSGVSAA